MNNNTYLNKIEKALLNSNAFFERKIYLFLVIGCLFLLYVFIHMQSPRYVLFIMEEKTEDILWSSLVKKNEWFEHEYIHSVEKSPVIEKFRVTSSSDIVIMESWTKSFGAGLPYEHEGTVELKNGFYITKDLNRPIHGGALIMKPSDLYPHVFRFQDQELFLSEEPFVKKIIRIDVQKIKWYEFWRRF
ncbi:DUF1850 domain-containing protein [Gracilibacillus sp. YIM 98692]|uniref:DUF1850 domain-containing protein n=1 Tax=Gracilibacillus sp. YIM 98692 TaxID=2663532 RepID=UPI0013D1FDD7|nr:DUF1850 domain-containing protein [Gracilibacillus sp. YIM 98692]